MTDDTEKETAEFTCGVTPSKAKQQRQIERAMVDSLAYRMAQDQVDRFAGESDELMKRHHQAMECLDCEAVLQLGIDAIRWLNRADFQFRKAIETGQAEFDEQVDVAIKHLYEAWLAPCEMANQWIGVQMTRGFTLEILEEFRECESEVRAVVAALKDDVSGSLSNADLAKLVKSRKPPVDWLEGDEEDLF